MASRIHGMDLECIAPSGRCIVCRTCPTSCYAFGTMAETGEPAPLCYACIGRIRAWRPPAPPDDPMERTCFSCGHVTPFKANGVLGSDRGCEAQPRPPSIEQVRKLRKPSRAIFGDNAFYNLGIDDVLALYKTPKPTVTPGKLCVNCFKPWGAYLASCQNCGYTLERLQAEVDAINRDAAERCADRCRDCGLIAADMDGTKCSNTRFHLGYIDSGGLWINRCDDMTPHACHWLDGASPKYEADKWCRGRGKS